MAFSLICLLWNAERSLAQTDKYVDKVVLTNGSVIWGLSEIEQDQVRIYLNSGDSISMPVEYIKSLKKGKLNPEYYQHRLEGVYYQVTTGVLLGKSYQYSGNEPGFTASFVSGYKFNRFWGAGLGMEVDFYPSQSHIPLFLEFQGDLLRGRVTPFYQVRTGWSWAEERNSLDETGRVEGGFFLSPALGVKWHFAGHSWHLQFSYVRQEATTRFEPVDFGNGQSITNVEDRVLQRMGIGVGISF